MNKSINPSIYFSDNSLLSESQEKSIFSLLFEINRKAILQSKARYVPQPKKIEFIVERKDINKKRGRTSKNENKTKFHDNKQVDNLLAKIQTHFLTFVIYFGNDALKDEFEYSKDYFRNINYENKRNVNFNYTTQLKNSTIKDLLKMDISIKNKKCKKTYNKELLERIENFSPSLSKLFEMSYLELFNKYYNKGFPLDKIVYKNKTINLSDKTKLKTFANLIDNNKNLEKDLIDIAENVYIC
jgi:hypothetical protein